MGLMMETRDRFSLRTTCAGPNCEKLLPINVKKSGRQGSQTVRTRLQGSLASEICLAFMRFSKLPMKWLPLLQR